jgi:hypothetical protein
MPTTYPAGAGGYMRISTARLELANSLVFATAPASSEFVAG